MPVQKGEVLSDVTEAPRWCILEQAKEWGKTKQLSVWQVEDQKPGLQRTLFLLTPNFQAWNRELDPMDQEDLAHSFRTMVNILCANYTFLPEPIQLVTLHNNHGVFEPGLVATQFTGMPMHTLDNQPRDKKEHLLRRTAFDCMNTLGALHRKQCVIRALPRTSMALSPVTFKPYFFGVEGLIRMQDFQGYNQNKICLSPPQVFSAPECFDSQGALTPATDIYALGKLIMQLTVSNQEYNRLIPPNDPFPLDMQNRINSLGLSSLWERFLAFCLHPDPKMRFQNVNEAKAYLSEDKTKYAQARQDHQKQGAQKEQKKRSNKSHTPWTYRPNSQLPSAALVFWSEGLTDKGTMFDFMALYKDVMYTYCLSPRIFFQLHSDPQAAQTNPFFKNVLQDKFQMDVVLFTPQNRKQQISLLMNKLQPESLFNLILVSQARNQVIQALLDHPQAKNWNIIWIRKGQGKTPIPIQKIWDAQAYIKQKRS